MSNYSMMSQEVDLSLNTTYSNLPALDASKVRMDNKVFVTLVLNDLSLEKYNVRLKLSIEGNGVSITSSELYNYKSYTLMPGVPKVISAFDLADYFNPESLDFKGIDKNAYLENGTLPEGMYKLCFVVVDGQSDGANTLSKTECDFLTLNYEEPPFITSDLNSVLDNKSVEWTHNSKFTNQVNYTLEIYEFHGGKDFEIYSYQRPTKVVNAGSKLSSDVTEELAKLPKDKLYAIFVMVENKPGSNYVFKKNGYSNVLYYENIYRMPDCDGEVEFTVVTTAGGTQFLYASVDGCDQLFGAFHYNGFYSNYVPLQPGTGYSANIYCENPDGSICQYSGVYGNSECMYGADCTTDNGCPGKYSYNCYCIEKCTSVPIRETYDAQGNLVLTPMEATEQMPNGLPPGCLGSASFQWSNGETTSSIVADNPSAGYSFTVVCADGCTYCGAYNSRAGCWPGRACYDGDPCTINDKLNANCDCVGEPIPNCDSTDPTSGCSGELGINLTVDANGGSLLTADLSDINNSLCAGGPVQYVWNNDYDINSDYYYSSEGGTVTLLIVCESGCTYFAQVDLNNCIPGSPCEDDNDPTTIEYYDENCVCVSFDCPDFDGDGVPDDCDEEQPCVGSISIVPDLPNQQLNVDIQTIDCGDGDITYLWSSGATTASIPFINENATYSVTVTCSTGCQYTATSEGGDDGCIVGAECENEKSCNGLGYINENCECIPMTPEYNFDANFNIGTNQITLGVELVDGECDSPSYRWSTGSELPTIVLTSLNSIYSVTVTCNNQCEFVAFYEYNTGDCVIGAPCNDGNPCTIYDEFTEDCDCVGTPITGDCEEDDPCTNFIPCDDGNPCTYFDQELCDQSGEGGNNDAECMGIYLYDENNEPVTDCGPDPCIVGNPCNDNDPCTINDVLDANCDCVGEQLYEPDDVTPLEDCEETNTCIETLTIDVFPTNIYNEVLLSAVSSCENVDSYVWSNGSGASSIVVGSQSGSYTVIVTCGDCQYTETYDTDGCLVGLPCNDGLDCTENDEVNEDCICVGEPIDDVVITFTDVVTYATLCDYKVCLPELNVDPTFYISTLSIILPTGELVTLNQGANGEGFNFPYTYNADGAGTYQNLVTDFNNWLTVPGDLSIDNTISEGCQISFMLTNSSVELFGISGYTSMIPNIHLNVENLGCEESDIAIGTSITANFDCEEVEGVQDQVQWSNGSDGPTVFIENIAMDACIGVTVTCANGCEYTATFGDNCEGCILGSPCDDGSACTINDTTNEDCECIGLPLSDSDNDGVCDEEDECPGADDNIDLNGNGVPDACDDELDCIGLLTAKIIVEVEKSPCFYCLFLNHPVFNPKDNDEEIYLNSIAIMEDGIPKILNADTPEFSFPYTIDKNSDVLLPNQLIDGLKTYFGQGTDLEISVAPKAECLEGQENNIEGPNLFGNLNLPSVLLNMKFVTESGEVVDVPFFNPDPCEGAANPFTLQAKLIEDCGGEPTYLWNTGSTESSIQVSSLLATYSVTVTCGECLTYAQTTPATGGGCQVNLPCTDLDICENEYDGYFDAFCNCVPLTEPDYPDDDDDGIPNCIDDCDSEFEQIVQGEQVCCDDPPKLIYDEEPVMKNVLNTCMLFKNTDIITGIKIYNTELNASNNYDQGGGDDDGNFFHFPYCMEENCAVYGAGIDVPYNMKPYTRFAYDLQKWAAFKGYTFTTSTVFNPFFCQKCEGKGPQLYINGLDAALGGVVILKESSQDWMNACSDKVIRGYNVIFEPYDGDCLVTHLYVNSKKVGQPIDLYNPDGINLEEFKFGPVPNFSVGYRARIECADGCVYDITTPDADCIVGDPCDSPDVCATETYTVFNHNGCLCLVLESNDVDEDGVCDDVDICLPELPYDGGYQEIYDDNLDNDNDGLPNCIDDFCGSEICTYIFNIDAFECDITNNGCFHIGQITVQLPDGSEVQLGEDQFVDGWYYFGPEPECTENQSEELENDILGWFNNQGYVVGTVTVENNFITITGSNVEFLHALNACRDEIPFNRVCESVGPNRCVGTIESCPIDYTCSGITNVEYVSLTDQNGVTYEFNGFTQGFNFPYQVDFEISNGSGITNPWNPNFINDLLTFSANQGLGIVIDNADYVNGVFIIESNVTFELITISCGNNLDGCRIFFECEQITSNACDDGWICTVNDQYDEDCNCVGTFLDSDNDMVCDSLDICEGYPDQIDSDGDGVPDKCDEDGFTIDCGENDKRSYCTYIEKFIDCSEGKVMYNNLFFISDKLKQLFENEDMINYIPFPNLKEEITTFNATNDYDNDGIVNILDPCPCTGANEDGTHGVDCMKQMCKIPECDIEDKFLDKTYIRERQAIMQMFLYTVNPGVLAGTNENDSEPTYSKCFDEKKDEYGLSEGRYNESGYVFSDLTGCYIYFELDCDCNCLVVESQAFNYAADCNEPIIIGEECTQDPDLEEEEGYHYVKCPPDGVTDPCLVYAVVPNENYDPYNPNGAAPCYCEQQMEENGEPSEMMDSDGDGVCDAFDECPGEVDADSDGDGVPDCDDVCDGIGFVETPGEAVDNPPSGQPVLIFATKEGYSMPTGPGDICDDGNPCTYDDVITIDCQCQGVYIDSDDDGVYDCDECEFVYLETVTEIVVINGEEVEKDKEIYGCVGCEGPVTVDAIGNITEPGAEDAVHTWIGCDICPGIPDGDPDDQDDFPMDYDNDGLPDCIDPPYYPIPCPVEYLIIPGVGISLVFDTDNIDVDKLPNPIRLLAKNENSDQLVDIPYLTVGFVREVGSTEIVDGEVVEIIQTEIIFEFDHEFVQEQLVNIQIMFSEHQVCTLDGIDDASPVPCPTNIFVYDGAIQLDFDINEDDNIDLSEFVGDVTIDPDGKDPATFPMDVNQSQTSDIVMIMYVYGEIPPDWGVITNFSGSITLPNGQVCNFSNGTVDDCMAVDESGASITVIPGSACDDGDPCTHHDKYVAQANSTTCICQGEPKPDTDNDTLCDEIDPCPDEPNAFDANGNVIVESCPCPTLELDAEMDQNPLLENGSDFYLHVTNDMSEYTDISIVIDDGQNDPIEMQLGATSPIIISNLTGGYVYTITITANCENSDPESLTYTVDVPFGDSPILCGVSLDPIDISQYSLLPSLSVGEEFIAADFEVNVREVQGSYGKYTGKGYISVPFFNLARLNVVFTDIIISNERQMIDGFLEIKGYGLAVLGDDISDAINSNLDDIIGVLEDISDVLETIIPILEDLEDFIATTGHLVDPLIVKCVEDNKLILEDLKAQAEAQPQPSEEELAAIKFQIETVSAILKDCMDQYNEQLDQILTKILSFIPDAIEFMSDDCTTDMTTITSNYNDNKAKSFTDYDSNISVLSSLFVAGGTPDPGMIQDNSYDAKIYSPVEGNVDEAVLDEALLFYEYQGKYELCNVIPELNSFIENNDLTKIQLSKFLKLVMGFGTDLSSIVGPDLKAGVLTHEEIFEKHKPEIENAFISVVEHSIYK